MSQDVVIVGAGPTGLACGIELKKRGISATLIDKGCVVNSLYDYPTNMTFFTTPELLEIGNIPMTSIGDKPVRVEALKYYRKVADHYQLSIRQYEKVSHITGEDGAFVVHTTDRRDIAHEYPAKKIILATGYYDRPNLLNVPGEDLPKVIHYYKDAHPFYDHDVLVVGAKNSAAIAALELFWNGARVTLAHRGDAISNSVKYWIKPNIENRIKSGEITGYFNTTVKEIRQGRRSARNARRRETDQERLRVRDDRLSSRSRVPGRPWHPARSGNAPSAHGRRNAGKRLQGHLPRRRDRGRHAHQRDLHRERSFPRREDRRRHRPVAICARTRDVTVRSCIRLAWTPSRDREGASPFALALLQFPTC